MRPGWSRSSECRRPSATSPCTRGTAVGLNDADAAAWADGAHALLTGVTVSGTRDEVRERLATLAEQGVTEIVYQPAGPDIRRELETFMEAASTSRA